MNQNITKIRARVNALFLNRNLQLNSTDYDIDQVAYLVDRMSDDICSQEKMMLLDQIKFAKRLSQKRNLLNDGDFESFNWSDENGWRRNTHVVVASGHPMFKGRYVNMPGATTTLSGTIVPAYMYQKVNESKLKPYTRYLIRGFVGNSQDLEVFVLRYAKEVYKKINVSNDHSYSNLSHTNGDGNGCYDRYPKQIMVQNSSDISKKPHEFTCHIDVGELNLNEGPGICIGFKIGTTDGMATLANLEMVEAHPLTGDAFARIKKREQKWKQKWIEKRMKIEKAVQVAQDAMQHLFTCPQQNRLKWTTTLTDIAYAETLIPKIPYLYDQFSFWDFPVLPREAYDILQQLSATVTTAQALYAQRNIVSNGDFRNELSNWNATDGIEIQPIQNTSSVLVMKDWGANVSQELCVNPEHAYLLRVTARKEGSGKGYVTISDCTEDNTETMTFISDEEILESTQSLRDMSIETASRGETPYVGGSNTMNVPPNRYGINPHLSTANMNHQSESFGFTPYGDQNQMINYPSSSPMTVQNVSSLSGYVTKTVEIFPETNRVRIEMGETAGTFMVKSVELIRIEQMNNQSVDVQTVAHDTTVTQSDSVSFTESQSSPRHFHYAYSHDSNIGYENPNWMAQISDNSTFSDLSLPGTHNTMARFGGDITKCQTMTLATQLNAGIRFLDIRCRHIENVFAIHHGPVYQNAMFGDVCNDVAAFLRKNPSETIFMRIKEEHTPANNTRSFADTFVDYKSRYKDLFWNWTSDNPRIHEIRGKVVVLQNFSGPRFGIPYNTLNTQDRYHLNTNWDLYDKWLFVKEHLYKADNAYKNGGKQPYLNYLSGSGGSFPYFVASGHSSPGTSAPRLSTGLTTPAFASWYPDFPRVNCFIGICTIAFEGTNILTSDLINVSNFQYVGIIAADFPGGGLIDNIIRLNRVEIRNGWYQIITSLNDRGVVDLNQSNNNVTLWNNNGGNNQKWKFVYNPSTREYQIKNLANENLV
ncbi:phosphatidylinositol-specific phospholipase C domain-containing protein, partial [Bacillus pacificus]|nr:phosphatidylinositol-specific phospholipase C domain-containing protein [Bacillus pacificus]